MHIYHNREPIVDAPVSTTYFVVEQDEVQTTKLLGPDGQPYAKQHGLEAD